MNINELKLLLTLNGNKRIGYLEEDIFVSDNDVILYYMEYILYRQARGMSWDRWSDSPMDMDDIPYVVYCYALNVIHDRFIIAEKFIFNSKCTYAEKYWRDFIQLDSNEH